MDSPNPISPALHGIPRLCPLCGQPQWDGREAVGGPVEDLHLGYDDQGNDIWSVCHVVCKARYVDRAVSILLDMHKQEMPDPDVGMQYIALRQAIQEEINADALIARLGTQYTSESNSN